MNIGVHSVGQQISLSLKKYTAEQIESFKQNIISSLSEQSISWEHTVKKALSVRIPEQMKNRRTTPRNRLFPYMRTGALKDSVSTLFTQRKGREGFDTFYFSGRISSPHGTYTNEGAGSDGSVGWLGWRDDVLFGDGRGNVQSLRLLFADIKALRRS